MAAADRQTYGGRSPRTAPGHRAPEAVERKLGEGARATGALGRQKRPKGSRKGPALLAALAGLGAAGAAGAAALKRRRSGEDQPPGYVPLTEPSAPATSAAEEARPPAGAA